MAYNSTRRNYRQFRSGGRNSIDFISRDAAFPGNGGFSLNNTLIAPGTNDIYNLSYGPTGLLTPRSGNGSDRSFSLANPRVSNGILLRNEISNQVYGAHNFATSGNTVNWTQSANMSGAGVAPSATGPDGRTSATRLTALGPSATLLLARGAIGTGNRVFSVWLRRVTGSGTVSLTLDNGTTWTDVTLSSTEWRRFRIIMAAGQVTCGIRILVQGDVVDAYGPQIFLVDASGNGVNEISGSDIVNSLRIASSNAVEAVLPRNPTVGVTLIAEYEMGSEEYSFHGANGVFNRSYYGNVVASLGAFDGEVSVGFNYGHSGAGAFAGNVVATDNITTMTENSVPMTISGFSPVIRVALTARNGFLAAGASFTDTFAVLSNPSILFDATGQNLPYFASFIFDGTGFVRGGSCYLRRCEIWPYSVPVSRLQNWVSSGTYPNFV